MAVLSREKPGRTMIEDPLDSPSAKPPTPVAAYIQLSLAALALAVGARLLYGRSGPLAALLLVAACLAFFALAARLVGSTRAALALLSIGAGLTRYTIDIFGLSLKVEHLAVLIGAALVAARIVRRHTPLRLDLPSALLFGWLGLNALAAVLNAPHPGWSLKLTAMLALAIGAYVVVTQLVTDRATLIFAVGALLAVGVGVAAFGLVVQLIYPFGFNLGVQINPITRVPTVHGAQWEANIFGGFCATIALALLALRLTADAPWSRGRAEAGLLIALLGLEVSLARGAWLATLGGLGVLAIGALLLWRWHRDAIRLAPLRWALFALVLAGVSFALWLNPLVYAARYGNWATGSLRASTVTYTQPLVAGKPEPVSVTGGAGGGTSPVGTSLTPPPPSGAASAPKPDPSPAQRTPAPPIINNPGTLGTRVQSAGDVNDPTYSQRRQTIVQALRDTRLHPLIGWGVGSYGQKYINTSHQPDWLPTVSIRVLHDTGLIGALLFHAALVLLGWRAAVALWRSPDPEIRAVLFAALLGLVTLGAAYEITEGLQFTFFWLLAGTVAAGIRVATADQRQESSIRTVSLGPLGTIAYDRFRQGPRPPRAPAPAHAGPPQVPAHRRTWRPGSATFSARRAKLAANPGLWSVPLIAGVGLVASLYRLDARGLSTDEIRTVAWHTRDLSAAVRTTADFPLYPTLARLATHFDHGEIAARLPAALLAVVAASALYLLGRRLLDARTGLVAALGLAVAPIFVWHAQEAGPYSGLVAYSLLLLVSWLTLTQRPTWRSGIGFALAALLGLLNHALGLLPLLTIILLNLGWVLFTIRRTGRTDEAGLLNDRDRALRTLGATLAGGLLVAVVTLPLLLPPLRFIFSGRATPIALSPAQALGFIGAGEGWPVFVLGALFSAGIAILALRRQWVALAVLGGWLALPLVALLLLNGRYPFDERYLLLLQPTYFLVIAYGAIGLGDLLIARLPRSQPTMLMRALPALVACAGLALVLLPPTRAGYQVPRALDWEIACADLRGRISVGDRMLGDAPADRVAEWCFGQYGGVSITAPGAKSLTTVKRSGQNAWYLAIGAAPKDADFTAQGFTRSAAIAKSPPGGGLAGLSDRRGLFAQATESVTLYSLRAPQAPASYDFRDVAGGSATPSYSQVGPGGDYEIALALPTTAPRILRLTVFDLAGRDLEVYVNDELLKRIKTGASGGQWVPFDLPLPPTVGASFTLRLHGAGLDLAAFSDVEVRQADR